MRWKIFLACTAFAIGCAIASSAAAQSDKQFLSEAIRGDNAEISLGHLAAEKGGSDGVRAFGQTLATDHAQGKKEAAALATNLEVKVTDGIGQEAQQEIEKLRGLSGQDFDKEFVRYMISEHEKDIAAFKAKAGEGDRPASALAKKTLPVLQKHLQLAQSLGGR